MNKLAVRCVARSEEAIENFNKRNGDIGAKFLVGCESYYDILSSEIDNSDFDNCIIVHDDVVLPRGFSEIVQGLISRLDAEWPDWGVAGNAGVSAWKFGPSSSHIARFVADPHNGPNVRGVDVPCSSIDGNVMLLNTRRMREKRLEIPKWGGFQLYDVVLCLESLKVGCAVIAVPELTCVHLSKGNQRSFDQFKTTSVFRGYLNKTIKLDYFESLNGRIERDTGDWRAHSGRLDPNYAALVNASSGREKRTLNIVIRTQFRSINLLLRTLNSISYFKALSSKHLITKVVLITDCVAPTNLDLSSVDSVRMYELHDTADTRFRLIQSYIDDCDADFSWFIDDDDWVFPNVAEELALILNSAPLNSIIFCNTQQFHESVSDNGNISNSAYVCRAGTRFDASAWPLSLGFDNHTPFPGMILPKVGLASLNDIAGLNEILYFEDHFILKNVLLTCNLFPIVFDSLSVGISVRTSDNKELANTVTQNDRTKWNISAAQKYWVLNNARTGFPLYELYENMHIPTVAPDFSKPQSKSFKRKALMSGLFLILSNPSQYKHHWININNLMKHEGFRGVKLYIRRIGKEKYRKRFGCN